MIDVISKNWFVLCTKPRNELKVKERLTSIGIEAYTPTRIEVRQWSDRKKKILVPLLPSMVLVSLLEKQVDQVFEVPGVVRYLFEHGKRAKVSNQEVLAMQRYLENTYQATQKELEVGDTVKVPLLEQEATLLSIKGKKCLAQLQKIGALVSFQLQ
ncbi:Transcription termination/antitermination protein NusG [Polaribacter huanghezhanensis]|uniref:UpxY family transcription antiterminator n=1 Tax=Polaribacter huanghezhanensis TaxID=1354726 RepID=UPI0026479C43|nr:UpxY family transcription antiterminator [Polaribacter huanghezhanensis]WKD86095.1 Transcription termination/antitermination protein NusG [Polaribacter huanghezhanensis]